MTTAERLRAEGRAEGRISGMARTLLNQISLKFGEPDQVTRARIEAADEGQLERWTARILTAPTLDALFE